MLSLPSLRELDCARAHLPLQAPRPTCVTGFDRLAELVRRVMNRHPLSGSLFLFRSRSGSGSFTQVRQAPSSSCTSTTAPSLRHCMRRGSESSTRPLLTWPGRGHVGGVEKIRSAMIWGLLFGNG